MSYYTILTSVGAAALTNAYVSGLTVNLTHIAVGDGNGNPITAVESMTALVHEVHRVPISALSVDASNANWLIAESAIPSNVGGWTVREIGLFDEDGLMVAVGNFPDTYKPLLEEGSARDLLIRMIIQTSKASVVNLTVDPSVVVATIGTINNAIAAHVALPNPHTVYVLDSELEAHINDPGDPHEAAGYIKQSELQGLLDVEAVPQSLDVETLTANVLAGSQIDVGFDYIANGLFLEVYRNGLRMVIGADNDYQEVVANPLNESRYVTFNYNLPSGDQLMFSVSGLVNMDDVYASKSYFNRVKRYFFGQL